MKKLLTTAFYYLTYFSKRNRQLRQIEAYKEFIRQYEIDSRPVVRQLTPDEKLMAKIGFEGTWDEFRLANARSASRDDRDCLYDVVDGHYVPTKIPGLYVLGDYNRAPDANRYDAEFIPIEAEVKVEFPDSPQHSLEHPATEMRKVTFFQVKKKERPTEEQK